MSYEKQNFTEGQVLKAEHLNHIEAGIVAAMEKESTVSPEELESAINDYFVKNPVDGGKDGVGIASVEKTYTEGLVDTYVITFTDNSTFIYTVTNGKDGEDGKDGSGAEVTDEQIAEAVTNYLAENPIEAVTDEQIAEAVTNYLTDNPIESSGEVHYYKPIRVETTAGIYRKNDGTIGDSTIETDTYIKRVTATNAEQYVEVAAGEVYRISIGSIAAIPASFGVTQCVFLDDNDRLTENAFNTLNYKENALVTVPEGATKMHFTVWTGNTFTVEKQTTEPYGIVNEFELLNEMEKLQQEQQTFERKTFAPFDKGYVTFVNDDCRSTVGEIVAVFVEKGIPLSLAALYGAFTNLTANGTVLDAVRLAVENGGEVLAHNPTPITETEIDDFNSLYNVFAKNKEMLEMYGFDVNGIILAGGNGQIVGSQKTDKWVRKYYQYSDLYGNTEYGYPYYHYRTALSNLTLEKAKAKIDEAIASKEWVIFYLHEWAEFSQSDMEALLDYINEKDSRELGVATYKQMYDNFCVKYGKRIVSITAKKATTVYETKATINTDDITVTAYYDDGTTEEITSGITVDLSSVDTTTASDYWIGVTYSGKTVYLAVTIYSTGDRAVLYNGMVGSYITWELYNDGTLELANTATWKQSVPNYTDGEQPWYEHMSNIRKVKINAGNFGLDKLGEYAFYGATNLTEIDFAENSGSVSLGAYTFGNCGLVTAVAENVYSISTNAFNGCPITEITLGVSVLSYNTFDGCSSLEVIRFTSKATTIDGNAFYGVKNTLTAVYVPWAEGEVANAPWGLAPEIIHYNSTT